MEVRRRENRLCEHNSKGQLKESEINSCMHFQHFLASHQYFGSTRILRRVHPSWQLCQGESSHTLSCQAFLFTSVTMDFSIVLWYPHAHSVHSKPSIFLFISASFSETASHSCKSLFTSSSLPLSSPLC